MKCVFTSQWECGFEHQDLPLEVCKICIQAKKIAQESSRVQLKLPPRAEYKPRIAQLLERYFNSGLISEKTYSELKQALEQLE